MARTLPKDIKPEWLNVIRRLQSVAKDGNNGLAVVNISVMVDKDGLPVFWSEPIRCKIEPKRAAQDVINMLTAAQNVITVLTQDSFVE